MTAFKRGTVFLHGKWLEPDQPGEEGTLLRPGRLPALCRVTAIRHGQVYYGFGLHATKGSMYQSPEKLLADGARILTGEDVLALPAGYTR